MVFYPPEWAPKLPVVPDDVPICDFMLDERYGRHPFRYSSDPFTCGISAKSYSALDVVDRVDFLARALAKEFDWQPNQGAEWDKVVVVFSVNTVSGGLENLTGRPCFSIPN
jgi:ribosome assembly protein SQT1